MKTQAEKFMQSRKLAEQLTTLIAVVIEEFAARLETRLRTGALPSRLSHKRTDEQMRCRHMYLHGGGRCKNRSKGPRYHYLCIQHRSLPTRKSKLGKLKGNKVVKLRKAG